MEPGQTPHALYRAEKEKYAARLQQLTRKHNGLGWARLAIIILTGVIGFWLFPINLLWGSVAVAVGLVLFVAIVSVDTDNNEQISTAKTLLHLNEEELRVLEGDYAHRYDGGEFIPPVHDYAHDLDVLGKASLFQYINRCETEQGKALLAGNLLAPLVAGQVAERQEAARELAPQYEWRQRLQAITAQRPVSRQTQRRAEQWLALDEEHFAAKQWTYIIPIYSFLTVLSAVAALAGWMPSSLFGFLFVLYLIISSSISKKALSSYNYLNGMVKEVDTLQQLMQWVEEKEFRSPLLRRLQKSVQVDGAKAYVQIRRLREILNRFDLRLNMLVFIFLNSFLLWDVRQMRALNGWREKNRHRLPQWFELIGELEVVNSLATLHFNEPSWSWPTLEETYFAFRGTEVGHPLIPGAQRVTSDFTLSGTARVGLITGSNMAGKSTFLRSLGVNTVLAQVGAPVCARSLALSPVRLMSSMRIADNLAENTSTFYAELKKLKTIIDVIRTHEPVFVLLDEVLRGTNSLDRHIGSKALIKQIIREEAVAVIATHDVEIAALETEYPQSLENYHFDVQVEGEELYFDYRLKHGVCQSLNASILMKKIGIEL